MDLRINYEEIVTIGNQITEKGNEFHDLLERIKDINSELQTYWEGKDALRYSKKVAEQAIDMKKLYENINEIGTFLIKVGKAYQEACENNANSIK